MTKLARIAAAALATTALAAVTLVHAQTPQAADAKPGANASPPALPPLPPRGLPAEEFRALENQTAPLLPSQIRQLKKLIDEAQAAEDAPVGPPPKAVSYSLTVSLSPGEAPPTIRTAGRFVTSVVFVDGHGAPWPVKGWALGDERRFDVQQPVKDGNVLTVTPKRDHSHASLAVFLQDYPTPVSLLLVTGQKEVDTRVDLKLQGRGPKAVDPVLNRVPEGDRYLISFLDGVIPEGAKALAVRGGVAEAWIYAKKMYVKTRLPIISPAWRDRVASSDGTAVYVMPEASIVLASLNGQIVNLKMTGQ